MKKLFGWIFEKKQEQVELFEVRHYQMVDEKSRAYNKTHGLPLDQLVGWFKIISLDVSIRSHALVCGVQLIYPKKFPHKSLLKIEYLRSTSGSGCGLKH